MGGWPVFCLNVMNVMFFITFNYEVIYERPLCNFAVKYNIIYF